MVFEFQMFFVVLVFCIFSVVFSFLVKEGDHVKLGQVLVRMNDIQTKAQAEITRVQLYAARAVEARLLAERDGKHEITFPAELLSQQADSRIANNMIIQNQLFTSRKLALHHEIAALDENSAGLKVGLSVSFSSHADETASLCSVICPDSHWLESWNDFMPKPGHYALAQPAITPLFDTRQWPESLLTWSGASGNYHDHIKGVWQAAMTSRTDMPVDFTTAWNTSIHNGVYEAYTNAAEPLAFEGNLTEAASTAKESVKGAGEWEVQLYTKESIGSGLHANNPWLQEVPDPLTKVTWDNYVCMAPADLLRLTKKTEVKELRIGEQDDAHIVKVTIGNTVLELPAVPLPGQTPMTVSIALGYGRGANGENVGRSIRYGYLSVEYGRFKPLYHC